MPKQTTSWEIRIDTFIKENSIDLSPFGAWLPSEIKEIFREELSKALQQKVREVRKEVEEGKGYFCTLWCGCGNAQRDKILNLPSLSLPEDNQTKE